MVYPKLGRSMPQSNGNWEVKDQERSDRKAEKVILDVS